jgi:hypothetical protein
MSIEDDDRIIEDISQRINQKNTDFDDFVSEVIKNIDYYEELINKRDYYLDKLKCVTKDLEKDKVIQDNDKKKDKDENPEKDCSEIINKYKKYFDDVKQLLDGSKYDKDRYLDRHARFVRYLKGKFMKDNHSSTADDDEDYSDEQEYLNQLEKSKQFPINDGDGENNNVTRGITKQKSLNLNDVEKSMNDDINGAMDKFKKGNVEEKVDEIEDKIKKNQNPEFNFKYGKGGRKRRVRKSKKNKKSYRRRRTTKRG